VIALHGVVCALAILFLGWWGKMALHCLGRYAWGTQKNQLVILLLDCHSVYPSLLQSVFVLLIMKLWGCLKCISLARFTSHVFLGFLDPLFHVCLVQCLSVALDLWASKSFQWEQQIWAVSDTLAFLCCHVSLGVHQPASKLLT